MRKSPYLKFKAYLVEQNISQKELSLYLGITEQTLSAKINRNGQDFTLSQVKQICDKYKISADEFFLI